MTETRLDSPVDAHATLARLAMTRRVFHSEADFQFAFASEAKVLRPDLEGRLENHPEHHVRLDVELTDPDSGHGVRLS